MNTAQAMKQWGFDIEVTDNLFKVKADVSSVNLYASNRRDLQFSRKNNHFVHQTVLNGTYAFCGGTLAGIERNLAGHIDMSPFIAAKELLSSGSLVDRLKTAMMEVCPRRRRVMSEHDGDLDFDRRYEITPYHHTIKAPGMGRCIDLVFDFSISCMSSAESINRYGAWAWALSQIVEESGIQTRIIIRQDTNGLAIGINEFQMDIVLKYHGEYISPSFLASIFQSNFYRRINFGIEVALADAIKQDADATLGRCKRGKPAIAFTDGELQMCPNISDALDETVEQEILKAIGVNPVSMSA